ncbi:MAG: cyclic nucleotide-binding domain-containing protein [Proteobacteria bacterium]|nr:cyclic nucleotide-binding domain-containing protein [Pseudomonadota bacterium]
MKQNDHTLESQELENLPMDVSDIIAHKTRSRLMDRVLPYAKTMQCRKNMEVIIGGMESASFYYLSQGAVEVSYPLGETRIVVALIGAGHFFGESGFFDRSYRIRDIRAVEDAVIHVFDSDALNRLQINKTSLFGQLMMVVSFSISQKFRRILDEREPLTAYAASLSTGQRTQTPEPGIRYDFLKTPMGIMAQGQIDTFFKSRVFDFSCLLQKDPAPVISHDLKRQGEDMFNEFNSMMEGFQFLLLDDDAKASLWQYLFKEAFPYVMRSRFAERSYFKPKGYAGDFMTIEMLYQDTPQGDGKIGTLMDAWCLNSPAAQAVRKRRDLLAREIETICHDKITSGKTVSIMNLACGPCRELADFIGRCDHSEAIRAICVDIDPDALKYAHTVLSSFEHKATISLMQENLVKWCMGRVEHDFGPQDIIYSSGLMDYLDDRLFKAMVARCHDQLAPGGVLMLGNFSPKNPIRMFMDHMLDWKLIHRSETDLIHLHDDSPFRGHVRVISEAQGINLFSVATKPS